jgi:hypothetical protein
MQKYNVVLDTNIYFKNHSRTDLSFQALKRLCQANIVMLHLPYIIEREFQTQQVALCRSKLETASSALNTVLRSNLPIAQATDLAKINAALEAITQPILADVEAAITNWAVSIGAQRYSITEQQARAALEAYFCGKPPLKAPKNREDIPDSFIYQDILAINGSGVPLFVISDDEKIASASEALTGVIVHRSLASFIASPEIQREIKDLEKLESMKKIADGLHEVEKQHHNFSEEIRKKGSSMLAGKVIHSASIRDDNNEATISSYCDPENIEFDFTKVCAFGNKEFGIPFAFTTKVLADYYIFKSEYYALEEILSVSDFSDHYFEVEVEFDVDGTGWVMVTMNLSKMGRVEEVTIGDIIKVAIDSIEHIEVMERISG